MEIKYGQLRRDCTEALFSKGKGYSDMSKDLSIHLTQVSLFMNGFKTIGKKHIPKICDYLELSIKDYYTIE